MIEVVALALSLFLPQQPGNPAPETGTLSGRVVDLRGDGVPLAEIWIGDADENGDKTARTIADAEGYFRLSRVPEGSRWVYATAESRHLGRDYVGSLAETVHIEVHDAATLRGVLRDTGGKPVAGAVVSASPAGRALTRSPRTATTDEQGHFAITKVPLGLSQLTAWVPGQGLAELRHRVAGDDEVTLVASAEKTTSFSITIEGLPEKDRPQVSLQWLPYRSGSLTHLPEPYRQPRIEGNQWRAEGLPDWQYNVSLAATGYAFTPDAVRLEQGKGPHQIAFVAAKKGTTGLSCPASVTDAEGQPVAGVSFVLRRSNGGARATATSDDEGKLTFDSPLGAGTKVVVYSTTDAWVIDQPKSADLIGSHDRRFLEEHECLVAPDQELQLRVIPASSVRGRLLHADGKPAAFTRVTLAEETPGRWPQWMTFAYATTDRDGNFHFRRLHHSPNGTRVEVEGAAGTATGEPFVIGEPGTQAVVPPLTLAPPSIVEGTVRDDAGHPVPGMAVWLRDWNFETDSQRSGSVTEVITDRQGRYRFLGVPVGGAWLQLVPNDDMNQHRKVVEPFAVEAGQTYTHDVVDKPQ